MRGLKDEAKRTALEMRRVVTPGIDNGTGADAAEKAPGRAALQKFAAEHGLALDPAC
jgi:hypothetical protein